MQTAGQQLSAGLIRARTDALLGRLRRAALTAGRDPDGFRLVAVTKGFGAPVVLAAREAGLTAFGENRVQEAAAKVEAVPDVEWHLVGRLQSNKARAALRLFGTIHSVDSVALLERLERIAHDDGRRPALLLQVNVTGDASKAGFAAAALDSRLVAALRQLHAARVVGLMTIGPMHAPPDAARAAFARLRELRDRLQDALARPLPELSMGMSADAEAAVAEGATLVRVGTAIFGPRPAVPA